MKNAVRLVVYFIATILIGALLAPILFWSAQALAAHGILPGLAQFDFQTFVHRAVLVVAVALFWPLLRSVGFVKVANLGLVPNSKWLRDVIAGFLISSIPLLCCGAVLLAAHVFSIRVTLTFPTALKIIAATITVPLIEETFFRGLIFGILVRSGRVYWAIFATSALYSILHFLKGPERTSTIVSWNSGFVSIANSFSQFADPVYVLAGFTTLFLIGWILADARLQTRSLWLPIGLHAGWIFASQSFSKIGHRQMIVPPWLGKNLLVGIVPLLVAGLSWAIMRLWLQRNVTRAQKSI